MTIRIFNVAWGSLDNENYVAKNIKDAITKAMKAHEDQTGYSLHAITEVELLAEADEA